MAGRDKIPADLKKNSKGAGVSRVQEYLERFGYLGAITETLEEFGEAPFPMAEGDDFATLTGRPPLQRRAASTKRPSKPYAVSRSSHGLPVTGVVDEATAEKMNQPGAAIPTMPGLRRSQPRAVGGRQTTSATPIRTSLPDMSSGEPPWRSSRRWHCGRRIRRCVSARVTLAAGPEIIIRFGPGTMGMASPSTDQAGSWLTPSSRPYHLLRSRLSWVTRTSTRPRRGRSNVPPAAGTIDLVTVAAHEFGHSLGLGHSSVAERADGTVLRRSAPCVEADDINGIRSLYGGFAIEHAMWAHGTDLHVEVDANVESLTRFGFFTRVVGRANTTNWYHFAIPTPVIVSGNRLAFCRAMLRLVTGGTNSVVRDVHVYDGSARIAAHQFVNLSGSLPFAVFGVAHKPDVFWGAGISVGVRTGGGTAAQRRMDFISAGVDFLS